MTVVTISTNALPASHVVVAITRPGDKKTFYTGVNGDLNQSQALDYLKSLNPAGTAITLVLAERLPLHTPVTLLSITAEDLEAVA